MGPEGVCVDPEGGCVDPEGGFVDPEGVCVGPEDAESSVLVGGAGSSGMPAAAMASSTHFGKGLSADAYVCVRVCVHVRTETRADGVESSTVTQKVDVLSG